MHNLFHRLGRLPNGANIDDCRPSEVGAGKTLHGRRHGGREHDSLVEELGGEGEGKRWEERGREERGVVGREEEGERKGGREGRREERGRERGREEVRGEGRGREGRGERGKRREWDKGYECMYGRGEREKNRDEYFTSEVLQILHSVRTVQCVHPHPLPIQACTSLG